MSLKLRKGESFNLSKGVNNLRKIYLGLGWEVIPGNHLDLDASTFLLGENGRLPADEYFIFYNNLQSPTGSVVHKGDNRSGMSEGDDEVILVNLHQMELEVEEIVVLATIHDGVERKQHFGLLKQAYLRIVDAETSSEILRFDLDHLYPGFTDLEFGKLKKENNQWIFQAVGMGSKIGLQGFVDMYV